MGKFFQEQGQDSAKNCFIVLDALFASNPELGFIVRIPESECERVLVCVRDQVKRLFRLKSLSSKLPKSCQLSVVVVRFPLLLTLHDSWRKLSTSSQVAANKWKRHEE